MRNFTLITVLLLVLTSCVGRKQIEKQLNTGNYDLAITNALKKLESNKDKKRKQDYVILLEEAYYKVVENDNNTINHLTKDGNPESFETIYNTYLNLEQRQNAIKPVLPLKIGKKTLKLKFNDYSDQIVNYRAKVSDYKYMQALQLIQTNDKFYNREAYALLNDIESINPNYKDIRLLMNDAHFNGTDFVLVTIENQTRQIIPARLESDLLNFDTYGLDQFWTAYHASSDSNIDYDYTMKLQLQRINISPEHITERELVRQKDIVDGWEYVLDSNGNVKKDSLGNDIKQDKIVNITARFLEVSQIKSTQVVARVVYTDLKQNQTLDNFPIDSEFIFENIFGTAKGDQRALLDEDLQLLRNRQIPFPSNEQMVYDTGEDLKYKLKDIITRYRFRN
ncbi:hypothetical protein [Psychroserpens sp. NJDZ02]|uniref:hypothetical protein n=1 Tax=Psychroserpens sp. NJDZ02 TaxID=2570561 RepID=UPI0010A894BC|nr:hypothetical protein [Psychroserpens sp. NJDZ02]QCE43362.1 hypothetical protein E9099_18700 [Psychroserpens sp. NJDZ02]